MLMFNVWRRAGFLGVFGGLAAAVACSVTPETTGMPAVAGSGGADAGTAGTAQIAGGSGIPATGGQAAAGAGMAAASGAGMSGMSAGGMDGAGTSAGTGGSGGVGPSAKCNIFADYTLPIEKLTETGCVDAQDPTKPSSYLIPYQVNSPLWSDAADKQRYMRIPDGAKIHVIDCVNEKTTTCATDLFTGVDGHWNYPVGTVLMKTFGFEGTLVETRLLMKFDDSNWTGFSYQWNQAQTEAIVQPNARRSATFKVGPSQRSQDWKYPSQADCTTCHTTYAGVTLGTETRQLNRMEGTANQLERLEQLGILDAPLSRPFLAPLLLHTGTEGSVQDRARSYLHSNCSYCHRPDGDQVLPDLRYTEPFNFKKMGICNAKPGRGDVGAGDAARYFAPGHPENSVISLRMKSLDTNVRMPQIATVVADANGVAAVDAWIQSVSACPP